MRFHILTLAIAFISNAWACNYRNIAGACTWYGDGPICGSSIDDSHSSTEYERFDHNPEPAVEALELAVSLATNGSGVEPGRELLTRDLHHRHHHPRRSCDAD
ncbi:hypothetical protein PENARI_c018G08731 [Penicillium arizonense]|uniref:Uncharacterized protein n=1 Tax=Penicillium arizonense TaxID=1835702 RepID=A0A1F5LA62_PENAI|nr:hypothetical protein PENARI_c018G08731 [Penicillium arizonense]OGE50094.1 hypothetical protein PENARI_c018G08731 [Penicillium arizonense]